MPKVPRLTRKEFSQQLAALRSTLELAIDADVSAFPIGERAGLERRTRCADSLLDFARIYFPHYIQSDFSATHKNLAENFTELIRSQKGGKRADAAPRGEGKSTLVTLIGVLWCIMYKYKHYIIIVMDSFGQAALQLAAIKVELEHNPRLRFDFPAYVGQGPRWRDGMIITVNGVLVQAAGSGMKLRGRRNGPHRPDLVVLDDVENDENVRTKEQRDKIETWILKAVFKLGAQGAPFAAYMIGTLLHYDSVLARLQRNKLFKSDRYRAIIRWPDRMDLWEKWEEVLLNEGLDEAEAFYRSRRSKMDEGAVISWPAVNTIFSLMVERAEDHASFDSERQNEPTDSENSPFKRILFWVQPDKRWIYFGSCDPSLGKSFTRGDPSAILVGGYNPFIPRLDVIEADIQRRVPDLIISRMIEFQREYPIVLWGVESVAFQDFLREQIMIYALKEGVPLSAVPTEGGNKELRILSLQPHVNAGRIRLSRHQKTMRDQLQFYGSTDYDDGPDALEMLYQLAVRNSVGALKGGNLIATRSRSQRLPTGGY